MTKASGKTVQPLVHVVSSSDRNFCYLQQAIFCYLASIFGTCRDLWEVWNRLQVAKEVQVIPIESLFGCFAFQTHHNNSLAFYITCFKNHSVFALQCLAQEALTWLKSKGYYDKSYNFYSDLATNLAAKGFKGVEVELIPINADRGLIMRMIVHEVATIPQALFSNYPDMTISPVCGGLVKLFLH